MYVGKIPRKAYASSASFPRDLDRKLTLSFSLYSFNFILRYFNVNIALFQFQYFNFNIAVRRNQEIICELVNRIIDRDSQAKLAV